MQALEALVDDWGITDRETAAAFLKSQSRLLRQQNRGLLRQKLRVTHLRSLCSFPCDALAVTN